MAMNPGFLNEQAGNGQINAVQFVVRQILRSSVTTSMICEIVAVDTTAQTVDLQPMVSQVTPTGKAIPHGVVHEVPYGYEQAGNCLIKIDPTVGDIGVAVFAHRDITRVKRTKKVAAPQTLRSHNYADALYVRTLWASSSPEHQITLDPTTGITMKSPIAVTIDAPLQVNGPINSTGDIKGGTVSLETHIHPVNGSVTEKPE